MVELKDNLKYKVLGVMSGTSLDGVDIAECYLQVSDNNNWSFKIGIAETIPYPIQWKERLKQAVAFKEDDLGVLNEEYTQFLANLISDFIERNQIVGLDAVCSHGHTILHQPEDGLTLQIGNLSKISEVIEKTVVCDFRVQDVSMGGQGAPLVPIGDRLLFSAYDYCLNLGGFANVSSEIDGQRIAYDICPVNIVLNDLTEKLGLSYDDEGKIARANRVNKDLLKELNALDFYLQSPPKSLGLEWVQKYIIPLLEDSKISVEDKISTFTEHVAVQLSAQFGENSQVLFTGGGAYNSYLLDRIRFHKNINMIVPPAEILEYKEALVFALLGVLKLRNQINCLASVTGARNDHSSGTIYWSS